MSECQHERVVDGVCRSCGGDVAFRGFVTWVTNKAENIQWFEPQDSQSWGIAAFSQCLGCGGPFPSNEPRPQCNVCEMCFCSFGCRESYHMKLGEPHNYHAPLANDGPGLVPPAQPDPQAQILERLGRMEGLLCQIDSISVTRTLKVLARLTEIEALLQKLLPPEPETDGEKIKRAMER